MRIIRAIEPEAVLAAVAEQEAVLTPEITRSQGLLSQLIAKRKAAANAQRPNNATPRKV